MMKKLMKEKLESLLEQLETALTLSIDAILLLECVKSCVLLYTTQTQ